jgi:outer membrane protein TolC
MKLNRLPLSVCVFLIGLLAVGTTEAQEPLSFRQAIELALRHSTEVALSNADETHAYQTYVEAHSSYIPQLFVGSNVGYAYGFPLSLEGAAPTLFNVTTQSTVVNLAQREFVRAAKAEWNVSKSQGRAQRSQVIMDAALTYLDLTRWEERKRILDSEMKVVRDVERSVAARISEGIDSRMEETKARLLEAQTRVHMTEADGAVDFLRTRLSQLTGLPSSSIKTARESIPALAESEKQLDTDATVQSSPSVELAEETAIAKQALAKGEHKALYPTADFAAQYGLINTSLTNFQDFFREGSFQSHNVTFGLVLRLPLFNATQRARAAVADADALRARKEVEQARNKAALDGIKARHNVEELSAARDVAQLRYDLANGELDATHARMEAEVGTQRELQNAAIGAAERSLDRMNADFELQRAQLELLRTNGALDQWALPGN